MVAAHKPGKVAGLGGDTDITRAPCRIRIEESRVDFESECLVF